MEALRVLVVDDSRFMRRVLTDVINADRAFTVAASASDGKEAVQLALELEPDLIIMDLEMPSMNGLEALRKIMAVRPVPVIMMSAVTDNGIRDTIKALQFGAFDFVRKPDNALHLDIDEVSSYLLERLHAAAAALREGEFRVMPAVDESREDAETGPEAAMPSETETAAAREEPLRAPGGGAPGNKHEDRHDPPKAGNSPATGGQPKTDGPPQPHTEARTSGPPVIGRKMPMPDRRQAGGPQDAAGAAQRLRPGGRAEAKKAGAEPKPALKPPLARSPLPKAPASSGQRGPVPDTAAIRRTPAEEAAHAPAVKPVPPAGEKDGTLHHAAEFRHIVVMGTSTGGPRALHEVLTRLPKDFEAPILIVQHMPPKFTHSLAQRLDTYCALKVREAAQGDLVEAGTVYIAPGGWHMRLTQEPSGKFRIQLSNEGPRNGHMPSVDVLFESLVGFRSLKRHAVLMTGMGSDGAVGMRKLQEDGSETRIAQSQETCVVYGMPGSAVKLGAASHVVPLQQIASVLLKEIRGAGPMNETNGSIR